MLRRAISICRQYSTPKSSKRVGEAVEGMVDLDGASRTHVLRRVGDVISAEEACLLPACDVIAWPRTPDDSSLSMQMKHFALDLYQQKKESAAANKASEANKALLDDVATVVALGIAAEVMESLAAPTIVKFFHSSDLFCDNAEHLLDLVGLKERHDEIKSKSTRTADEDVFIACYDNMVRSMGVDVASIDELHMIVTTSRSEKLRFLLKYRPPRDMP